MGIDTAVNSDGSSSPDSLVVGDGRRPVKNLPGFDLEQGVPQVVKGYYPMRVACVQTAPGLKPPSGGFRGNYALLHGLAAHGHKVTQFCWAFQKDINAAIAEVHAIGKKHDLAWGVTELHDQDNKPMSVKWWTLTNCHGIRLVALDAKTMCGTLTNEVQIVDTSIWHDTNELPARCVPYAKWLVRHIEERGITHMIFNDAFISKLTSMMPWFQNHAFRVEIVHTAEQLPLGPYKGGIPGSSCATLAEIAGWHELDGVISVSRAVETYAQKYCDLKTKMLPNHPWVFKDKETSNWPRRRFNFAKQRVAMINPATIKGYSIFLDMAKHNQVHDVPADFVAYKSWGSNAKMREELEAAGVRVYEAETDMEPVYDQITVLVVPSLWYEAWGIVVTEAQLRGIVVLASNAGGVPEAKRWVEPIIPVNIIGGTDRDKDGNYVVPKQDATPWIEELHRLLNDQEYYRAKADAAYYTTRNFVERFDARAHEQYLLDLKKKK